MAGRDQQPGPRCSVIVPVRDAGSALLSLLESVAPTADEQCRIEVVLSDDGSADDAVRRCADEEWPFELRVVEHADSSGAGAARNRGVRAASADILVFIDADDVAAPGFVDAITAPLRDGSAQLVAAARDYETLNTDLDAAASALRGSACEPTEMEPGSGILVSGGSGMAISRELFEALEGFDERLRRREDHDLWIRAQAAGHSIAFAKDAEVYVRRRSTRRAQLDQARADGEWAAVFFALHPELVGAQRRWASTVGARWILPRLLYAMVPSRRMVLAGGLARGLGWRQGQRRVRRMRRDGGLQERRRSPTGR